MTLQMEEKAQAFFEEMRRRYFPAERNQIGAHLTLFHTLPEAHELAETLRRVAGRSRFSMRVTGLRSLGRGVAYKLASGELLGLHAELSGAFVDHLTAQDRQRFMPHVVVQNKATPEAARALLAELERGFVPFEVEATGLELWNYLGGPWRLAEAFPFSE